MGIASTMLAAVTIGGNLLHPHIDANDNDVLRKGCRRLFHFASGSQVELATLINQVGLAMPVGQQAELAFTADKPDDPAPHQGPEGNGIARQIPRKQPIIVGMGTAGGKGTLAVMVESVGIGNFGNGAYFCRQRRIKSKCCRKPTASKAVVSDPVGGT